MGDDSSMHTVSPAPRHLGSVSATHRHYCPCIVQERRRKRQELLQLLQEKQEELDRLLMEEESLQRARQEQELLVAKLSDPGGPL